MTLSSRAPDPPGSGDHLKISSVEGALTVVLYADFECPRCALAYERLSVSGLTLGLRHFPIASRHPRAKAAAAAVEAAGVQGRFWEFAEALFMDQGRLDDPFLWAHAENLELDLARFEVDRQSEAIISAVNSSFRLAIRAGVGASPTLLVEGELIQGVPSPEQVAIWSSTRTA